MEIKNFVRNVKNRIVSDDRFFKFFLKAVNAPFLGDVYDFIYFQFIRSKIRKSGMSLTIEPSNICNLRCVMCPYRRMKRKKETMPMGFFKKIVDQAKALRCKEVHLTQYNEPFLDKYIFERIDYIRKKGMESSFYSNGTLLNKKVIEKILESPPNLIRFSVDSASKKIFESIRVGANYEKVVGNVMNLYKEREKRKQKLPIIEVFFTVLGKNKEGIKDFIKFWGGKCDFVSIYPADSRESGKFVGFNYKDLKPYPCFNPKKILVLSNGKVDLCCVDIDGKIILGDLKKQSLKEVLNSKKFKDVYNSQMERKCNIKMCENCSKFYIDSAFSWWFS